ncbi:MAG: SDR family NAD(P)-dependent oxidoreductase [Janthinobacterium lividum]
MPPSWTSIFSAVGGVSSAYISYCVLDFLYLHFLRPSSLPRYLPHPSTASNRPWALITGASDGIGKGFAEELCSRGFNIVLHGRNPDKLEAVKRALTAQNPTAQIKLVVLDAHPCDSAAIERVAASLLGEVPLTVLVNNVGGMGTVVPSFRTLQDTAPADLDQLLALNVRFATHITRALLPNLVQRQCLVINVGSVTAMLPQPWLGVYAGSKAYNLAWSRSLRAEMVAAGKEVEVLGLAVGEVKSQNNSGGEGVKLFKPSSRTLARAALAKVGCGRAVVVPYVLHALQIALMGLAPEWVVERLMVRVSREYMATEEKAKKQG